MDRKPIIVVDDEFPPSDSGTGPETTRVLDVQTAIDG